MAGPEQVLRHLGRYAPKKTPDACPRSSLLRVQSTYEFQLGRSRSCTAGCIGRPSRSRPHEQPFALGGPWPRWPVGDLVKKQHVTLGMTACALYLSTTGALFLFAPQEVGSAFGATATAGPLLQMLGAAFLGLGAMNWVARRGPLGGIYGRALVVANQVHFSVGAVVLVKHALVAEELGPYWTLAVIYVVGALLFNRLLFSGGTRAE